MRYFTPALLLLGAAGACGALVASPIVAAVPLGVLLLWVWLYNPSAGLVAAVATYPLQRSLLGMPAYVASVSPALLTGLSVLVRGLGTPSVPSLRRHAPQYLAVALFAYTVVSLFARAALEQPGATIPDVLATEGPTFYKYTAHALVLFLLLAHLARNRGSLRRVTWVHIGLLASLSALGLQHVLAGDNSLLRSYWGARSALSLIGPRFNQVTSVFFDPNQFANFLVSTVFVVLPVVFGAEERPRTKALTAPVVCVALVCACLCFSVANWLALAAGLATWLLLWGRRKTLLAVGTIALVAVLLAGNFGTPSMDFLPPDVYDKVDALARLDFGPDSALHIRADLVRGGMEMFHSSPLFGVGYGGYQPWIAKSRHYMEATKQIVYSHNSYVLVLAELGVVGLGMLLVLLGTCIHRGVRNVSRAPCRDLKARQIGLMAAIVANLVFLASYDSVLYSLNLWIPLGMTVAMTRVIDGEREKEAFGGECRISGGDATHGT